MIPTLKKNKGEVFGSFKRLTMEDAEECPLGGVAGAVACYLLRMPAKRLALRDEAHIAEGLGDSRLSESPSLFAATCPR